MTHLEHLRTQHAELKGISAVRSGSPLINEAWYGSISGKYKTAFTEPSKVPVLHRMQQLNEFLLDGILPDGNPVRAPRKLYNVHNPEKLKTGFIREICNSAYRIKENQYFQDGNHRTAILSIYEALADVDIMLDVAPMRLYAIISNRLEYTHEEVLENLFDNVWRNHHTTKMTLERRIENAMAVKDIQFWNTQVENFYSKLVSVKKQEARVLLRSCKRTNVRLYTGLKELHSLSQWS